jgi:hypothetical protein
VRVTRYVGPNHNYGFGVVTVPFKLPAHSKQGPDRWYLLNLHVALTLREDVKAAPAQVSASTNGFATIQIQVGRAGHRHGAVVDMLDLLQGEVRRTISSNLVTANESNYLQRSGVRGGANALSLRVESFGHNGIVQSARILSGTGIYVTAKAPSNLSIEAPRAVRIRTGSTVNLPVRLINTGDDARNVRLSVTANGDLLQLGSSSYEIPVVATQKPQTVKIRLRTLQPGRITIDFNAVSSGNQPAAQTSVTLYPYKRSSLALVLVCVAVFVPAVLVLAWPRTRRLLRRRSVARVR